MAKSQKEVKDTGKKKTTEKSSTKPKAVNTTKSNTPSKKKTNEVKEKEVKAVKEVAKKEAPKKDNEVKKETSNKEVKKEVSKKKRVFKYALYVIILVLLVLFGISGYKIISWRIDNSKTQKLIDDLNKSVDINNNSGENVELVADITDETLKYLVMDFIDVDLSKLKEENDEIVGWVQVAGTKVNYPFVQTSNNSYYLSHSIDKSINEAGWIFLDYRNKLWEDKNTIIYGHGRLNKTMFGSLNEILDSNWTDNEENFVIKTSTENENAVWQIFSAYHIENSSRPDYSVINFNSNQDFLDFANMLKDRSMYDFKATINGNDQILTLSTCYNNYEKMVIHAKLIKKSVKTVEEDTEK